MVNLSQSRRVKELPYEQIDGIGLLRSEWLMLEILDRRHPWHWIHQGQEAELQKPFGPGPGAHSAGPGK